MSEKFDWDEAVNEWQNNTPDLPELKKNMKWLSWRMKLILALDIIILIALIPLTFYIFQTKGDFSVKVWFVLVSIIAVVGVYFDFYLRRELWDIPTTTRGMYLHLIKRAKAGINIARFSVLYLSFFGVCLAGWATFVWKYEAFRYEQPSSVLNLCLGLAVIVISIIISIWYGKRKSQQLAEAEKRYDEFNDSDNE